MQSFRPLADRFTLVFYDHRCNGRSTGAPVSSMTWDNLTADADALREHLGYERWAVLGHSFRRAGGVGVRPPATGAGVPPGPGEHRRRRPLGAGARP